MLSGKCILNVKHTGHNFLNLILASLMLSLLLSIDFSALGVAASSSAQQSYGSLLELANKRRALLLVRRTGTIDVRGGLNSMIAEALKSDPRQSKRYRLAYNTIAGKLNKFMKKYKSISSAERLEDADYVIFFNLLEYRRALDAVYPYGELFVIVNHQPDAPGGPRVIWKSRKAQWGEDAINDLLNELKRMR